MDSPWTCSALVSSCRNTCSARCHSATTRRTTRKCSSRLSKRTNALTRSMKIVLTQLSKTCWTGYCLRIHVRGCKAPEGLKFLKISNLSWRVLIWLKCSARNPMRMCQDQNVQQMIWQLSRSSCYHPQMHIQRQIMDLSNALSLLRHLR